MSVDRDVAYASAVSRSTSTARLPFCETLIRAEWVAHEFDQRTGRNDLRPKCRAAIARPAILLHEEELGCTFSR